MSHLPTDGSGNLQAPKRKYTNELKFSRFVGVETPQKRHWQAKCNDISKCVQRAQNNERSVQVNALALHSQVPRRIDWSTLKDDKKVHG